MVARLWRELELDRSGTVVALGGGALTDVAGFAASTYLRGVPWVAVPTTLVGQVDAAIGGKTAIDLPEGKNLVGAFHWPARVVIDRALLETLPERERRQGVAELVKTGLLAGRLLLDGPRGARGVQVGALPPRPARPRAARHGSTSAIPSPTPSRRRRGSSSRTARQSRSGLLAALRLSGRDPKPRRGALDPQPVRVDRDAAWQALLRDKKRAGDEIVPRPARRRTARPSSHVRQTKCGRRCIRSSRERPLRRP